jgi:hypothetical protein
MHMPHPTTAGYSGTPLAKKLGIKAGTRMLLRDVPEDYMRLLEPLPDGLSFAARAAADVDIVHVFVTRGNELRQQLRALRAALRDDAAVWVSWPKKASGVATDITEDVIRELALPMGWVDIKVCAVDAVWSGLKLVVRKELRQR